MARRGIEGPRAGNPRWAAVACGFLGNGKMPGPAGPEAISQRAWREIYSMPVSRDDLVEALAA